MTVRLVHQHHRLRIRPADPFRLVNTDPQILYTALVELVHPSMHTLQLRLAPRIQVATPRRLHNLAPQHILHLHPDTRLHKLIHPLHAAVSRQPRQRRQPPPQRRSRLSLRWRLSQRSNARRGTPTARVPRDDDVLDADLEDGIGKDGEDVVVREVHLVGDVAGDENVTGFGGEEDGFGDAGVSAADPQDLCDEVKQWTTGKGKRMRGRARERNHSTTCGEVCARDKLAAVTLSSHRPSTYTATEGRPSSPQWRVTQTSIYPSFPSTCPPAS